MNDHKLDVEKVNESKCQQKLTDLFEKAPKEITKKTDRKFLLAREIALMVCLDLLPFSIVNGRGFRQLCLNRGIIVNEEEMPAPETISYAALDDVFHFTTCKLTNVLEKRSFHLYYHF